MTESQRSGRSRLTEGRVDILRRKKIVRSMDRQAANMFRPKVQSRSGIISLIRALIAQFQKPRKRTPEEEVRGCLTLAREGSPGQLAGMLARALLAKKTLDSTRNVDVPFPADILEGSAALDEAGHARLLSYVAEMRVFHDVCVAQDTILTTAVAGGLDIWIAVFQAMATPGQFETAREIWSRMEKGRGQALDALQFMIRRDVSDVEKLYITYSPIVLAG